ncbi:MAG: InlB B-repeat-containing protein, partial [Clostridia bacterium]|nr:InlB B-repeat-containing protein [Clostridia bacterium]
MSKQKSVLRMLSIIVVFAMLFCVVPVSANESIAYTLEVGSVSVDMDKTDATDGYYNVSVPIELTQNAGLISITAEVTYDEAITLTGWSEGEIFPISEGDVSEYNISSALSTDLAKNPYKIMYVASTVATQFYSTGTLMSLNFKVPYSVRSLDYPISVKVTSLITQDDSQETKPASEVSELASVVSGKISMKTEGSGVIPVALYEAENINVGIDKGANKFPTGSAEVVNVSTKYAYQHLLPGDITKVIDAVRYELKVTNTALKLSDARYVKIGYRTNSNNNTPLVGVWINNGTKDIRVYDKAFATFEKNDLWGETIYDLQQNYTGSSDSSIDLSNDASADWTSLKDNFFKGVCLRAYGANNSVIAEGSYFDVAYIALFNSAEDAQKYTYFKTATVEFKDGDTILATKNLVVGDRLVYPEEPEVAGKAFAGWDTQEGTLLLGDTVVNAIFKEDAKVNVKINAQNGTFTINDGEAISSYDEAVGAGETLELVATPATGYKFDGWYDVTGESDELITEESEYSLFVKAACELEARFVDVNAPEAPVAVFDLYANKDTKKHVVNYAKFSTHAYSQEDNAFKFTGNGSHNGKDMGISPDNVDFSDAGDAARKALIDSEADIGYLVVTYRNPQGMSSIKRRYIDNSKQDIKEDVALLNSGDDYYSVIIDVSGQRLWFRDYYDTANVSNIAFYPFSSLASDDTNSYDLYLRSIALTRDLKDAYGYCKSLVTAGDSAGYHLNGGDLITDEVEIEEFDLKISAQNGTFTVNGGEASTLVESKYEKDSKLTLVATAAENYEF